MSRKVLTISVEMSDLGREVRLWPPTVEHGDVVSHFD